MKVLFLNPPLLRKSWPQRNEACAKTLTRRYPIWLASAAGVLMENGLEVDFMDAPAAGLSMQDVERRAKAFGPSLIIVDTSTPSIKSDVSVASALKEACPQAFVCLVGPHVSVLSEEVLRMDVRIDAVARGEYDYTVLDLANSLKAGSGLREVKGLVFRQDGCAVSNPRRPLVEDLDRLPFVSRVYKKFLKPENYPGHNAPFPSVSIASSRGCPFPCTFCLYPQTLMGRRFRKRSAENVVEEMEYVARSFPQVKSIFFEDDTFAVDDGRLLEIAALIRKRGIKVPWAANTRTGLGYEAMRAIREAGCRALFAGFESGSQQILDAVKKKTAPSEMHEFMRSARRAGLLVHGYFMAGLPGETRQTLKATFDLAKSLNPDTVQFRPVMAYPGTEAFDWYFRRGLIKTLDYSKWTTPEGLHNTVIRTEELSSDDITRFCEEARRGFYIRTAYVFHRLRRLVNSPCELATALKSAAGFFKRLLTGHGEGVSASVREDDIIPKHY